jgi:HK97 gp10 family phage protein
MIPTVKVDGLKELQRALSKLPVELQRASETNALREGMKPVLKTARAKAPTDTGLLKKAMGLTVRKGKNGITARVGARTGFKGRSLGFKMVKRGKLKGQMTERFQDPSYYSHLVEYGTSHSAAKPFIRPAVENNTLEITAGLAKGYEKGMEKALAKVKSRK